jgi:DNA (cytosine-5)-methyltransferase 1
MTPYTLIDLFSGAGGMSEGFEQAGFNALVANDFDEDAAKTYQLNHPHVRFLSGPIQDISSESMLEAGKIKQKELDVLVGGPPCQAFSVYNHQRGMHDERSGLFREYLRIVEGLLPKFVVMENVTGLTSVADGRAVEEIYSSLQKFGYHVEHRILKAEEYGVPQERRRIFFIGSLEQKKIVWPNPICWPGSLFPCTTVWDAIGDLPPLQILEGEEESSYTTKPFSEYQKGLRKGSKKVFNHVAPYLAPINLERLKFIAPGGSWRDIPERLLPAGMKKAKKSDHTKRYGRLRTDGLASTILTKCDLHWGAFIHPNQERCLTVREAARLQSFPDRIRFTGSRGEQFRQVGNAVPPLLARAVANSILEMLTTGTQANKRLSSAPHNRRRNTRSAGKVDAQSC